MRPLENPDPVESGASRDRPSARSLLFARLGGAFALAGVVAVCGWFVAHPEPMQAVSATFAEMRRAFSGPGAS